MAYSELIKNFSKIRDYMRNFIYMVLRREKNSMKKVQEAMTMKDDV
mgnify:CR=1 FL=1